MKKRIFAAALLVALLLLSFVSCGSVEPEDNTVYSAADFFDAYANISTATGITEKITVRRGDFITAEETRTFDFATKKVRSEAKILNHVSDAEPWTTRTRTKDFNPSSLFGHINADDCKSVNVSGTTATLVVSGARAEKLFDLSSLEYKGDVTLKMELRFGKLVGMEANYATPFQDAVTVITEITYD